MSDLVNINLLVKNHLDIKPENRTLNAFNVQKSSLEGRGLIATKNINVGELIFVDHPLIMGPRTSLETPVGCVCCYKTENILRSCTKGCGLPVCSLTCENSQSHEIECKLITQWKVTDLRETLNLQSFARCIVPLRALVLSEHEKQFLLNLRVHESPRHGAEVQYVKKFFEVSKNEESLMKRACCALDANAYEMLMVTNNKENANLRGLFPVSALMNHSCMPNIRTDFDTTGKMYIRASVFIPRGEEICTSYTNLLWGTPARRHHLLNTKHFLCQCARCSDKYEFNTYLTALRCLDRSCSGSQLPNNPLDFSSNWCCEDCGLEVTPRQVGAIQSAMGGLIGSVQLGNPGEIYDSMKSKLIKFLPESNHIILELKCRIISSIGVTEGWKWNGNYKI